MKLKIITIAALVTFASVTNAKSVYSDRYYVGFDFGRSWYTTTNNRLSVSPTLTVNIYSANNNQASILGGYRWDNLAAQIGYTKMLNASNSGLMFNGIGLSTYSVTQRCSNFTADAIYFYKLNSEYEFKALLGLGALSTSITPTVTGFANLSKIESTKVGIRYGIGLDMRLSDNFTSDVMLKYQQPGNSVYKNFTTFSIQLAYHLPRM